MNNNRDFDIKLAKIQVAFTALITMGSILISLGASALDFSSTISLDAADKPQQVAQFLQQISNVKGTQGVYFIIIGLVILLGSIHVCWIKINKLKRFDSQRQQDPYSVKFLRGYGESFSLKDNGVIVKKGKMFYQINLKQKNILLP